LEPVGNRSVNHTNQRDPTKETLVTITHDTSTESRLRREGRFTVEGSPELQIGEQPIARDPSAVFQRLQGGGKKKSALPWLIAPAMVLAVGAIVYATTPPSGTAERTTATETTRTVAPAAAAPAAAAASPATAQSTTPAAATPPTAAAPVNPAIAARAAQSGADRVAPRPRTVARAPVNDAVVPPAPARADAAPTVTDTPAAPTTATPPIVAEPPALEAQPTPPAADTTAAEPAAPAEPTGAVNPPADAPLQQ
jgi:hypothetical protein